MDDLLLGRPNPLDVERGELLHGARPLARREGIHLFHAGPDRPRWRQNVLDFQRLVRRGSLEVVQRHVLLAGLGPRDCHDRDNFRGLLLDYRGNGLRDLLDHRVAHLFHKRLCHLVWFLPLLLRRLRRLRLLLACSLLLHAALPAQFVDCREEWVVLEHRRQVFKLLLLAPPLGVEVIISLLRDVLYADRSIALGNWRRLIRLIGRVLRLSDNRNNLLLKLRLLVKLEDGLLRSGLALRLHLLCSMLLRGLRPLEDLLFDYVLAEFRKRLRLGHLCDERRVLEGRYGVLENDRVSLDGDRANR